MMLQKEKPKSWCCVLSDTKSPKYSCTSLLRESREMMHIGLKQQYLKIQFVKKNN